MSRPWRYLSLFCGAGGGSLGFTRAGYECVGAFDADERAVRDHGRRMWLDIVTALDVGGQVAAQPVTRRAPPVAMFTAVGDRLYSGDRLRRLYRAVQPTSIVPPRVSDGPDSGLILMLGEGRVGGILPVRFRPASLPHTVWRWEVEP